MTLDQMEATARNLSLEMFVSDQDLPCSNSVRCLEREEKRFLTPAEKKLGWARRPFWAYLTTNMCNSCAAYYHAERAAQVLHEMACTSKRLQSCQKTS